jgi:hypothetical protein
MNFTEPKIQAALVAAVVTISVLILKGISKPIWEKYFHTFKLESDYNFEQKKKVKEAISLHKVALLNAAESLNHRMWNFSKNAGEGWHRLDDDYEISDKYYLQSFCYRFLLFFSICREIEKEMVYLDSTVSTSTDLTFIKYIKLFPQLLCDVSIFKGIEYDKSKDTDHFYSDDFKALLKKMNSDKKLLEFEEFKSLNLESDFGKVVQYFSGISFEKNCLRWQVLNSFHFILMAFVNDFGYDFQVTNKKQLNELAEDLPINSISKNLESFIKRSRLDKNKNIKMAMKALKRV